MWRLLQARHSTSTNTNTNTKQNNTIQHNWLQCVWVHAGKSAAMILRQINAEALADAKAFHLEQTCAWLQACHLSSQAPTMDAGGASLDPLSPHNQANAR